MNKRFLFTFLSLALALPASAAEWIRVRTPGEGDQYFYDRSKLFINGDEVTYWKKVIFRVPQPVKNQFAASGLYRERIHCTEHTLKLISYLLYATDSSTIEYVPAHENEAAPIIPDTLGDVFEKITCDLVRLKHLDQHRAEETVRTHDISQSPSTSPPQAAALKKPSPEAPVVEQKTAPFVSPPLGSEPSIPDMN